MIVALAMTAAVTFQTQPTYAGGTTNAIRTGISKFLGWTEKSAENLKSKVAPKTISAGGESLPAAVTRNFEKSGLLKDMTPKVSEPDYLPTLWRDNDLMLFESKLANSNNMGVIIQGDSGVGKTQLLYGLIEDLKKSAVNDSLKNAHVIEVDTRNNLFNSVDSFADKLESMKTEIGRSDSVFIIYFNNIEKFIPENSSLKIDEYIEAAQRKLGTSNTRIVIEGSETQINKLAERSSVTAQLSRQTVKALSRSAIEEIVAAAAKKLEQQSGHQISKEMIRKSITYAESYYSSTPMPRAAIKLLSDVIALKKARIVKPGSSISTLLEDKKNALIKELDYAREVIRERPNALFASQRANEIPTELKAINKSISEITEKFKKFNEALPEYNALLAELTIARNQGIATLGSEKIKKIEELKPIITTLQSEDFALFIHLDKSVNIEELLVKYRPLSLEERIRKYSEKIFGQDHIINILAKYGENIRSIFRPKFSPPAAKILLLGPPGTGKTEMMRTASLVQYGSYDNLIQKNMEDYAIKHSSSGITGAAPGYVGYGEGNDLVSLVIQKPESVIGLDEIEKADRDLMNNTFLKLLSQGHMVNTAGKSADFSRTMVIATSNLGQELPRNTPRAAIEEYFIAHGFTKEFMDRWDEIIITNPIEESFWGKILDIGVNQLNKDALAQTLNFVKLTEKAKIGILNTVEIGASKSSRGVQRALEKFKMQITNVFERGFYKNGRDESIPFQIKPGDLVEADWDDASGLVFRTVEK